VPRMWASVVTSFMDAYNDAWGSFHDGVRQALYGDDPSDEQLEKMLARKHGAGFAARVGAVLKEDTQFSAAVRRAAVREFHRER